MVSFNAREKLADLGFEKGVATLGSVDHILISQ